MRKINTISKILKLKDGKKQEIEIEVKKAADRLEEEKNKLKNLQSDYQTKLKQFNENNESGALNINKINSYYEYFAMIDGKIKEQKQFHLKRKKELEVIREHLIDAHKDKKMMEILKDKAVKENMKERELSARKEADYLVLARKLRC